MRLRCPYCRNTFTESAGVKCPHCGKFVNLPPRLRTGRKSLRVSRRDIESRLDEQRRDTLTPTFTFGRTPSTLLVALAVLVIVGGLLLSRVATRFDTAHRRTRGMVAVDAVETLAEASRIFAKECGRLPSTDEGFIVLISNPGIKGWAGPYINLIKPDPWEQPYSYTLTNGVAVITSSGPDQTLGTRDDIIATTSEL